MRTTNTKICAFLFLAALTACTHDSPAPDTPSDTIGSPQGTALVLCEGIWSSNDAALSLLNCDSLTINNEWFEEINGRGLGDVAQDILAYGSRAYATVTFSNSLEAISIANGHSTRHDMGGLKPRYIAACDGRLYISCYGGHKVVAYDTANLGTPVATYTLGNYQPEGLAVASGRLFVASSWIADENMNYTYDNCIYVFDLATDTLVQTLEVGSNPQLVMSLGDGRIAVNYQGNYYDIAAGCAIVDATTLEVTQLGRAATGMATSGGMLYGFTRTGYGEGSSATYWKTDGTNFDDIAIDIANPYGISIDDSTGCIYVCTDGNYTAAGDVVCHRHDGTRLWSMEAAMLPKKIVRIQ